MFSLLSNSTKKDTLTATYLFYTKNLDSLRFAVLDMQANFRQIDQQSLQIRFKKARYYYKQIEWLVAYHYSETAEKLNAPNLLEAKSSMPNLPLFPTGFQVLEEAVFDSESYNRQQINSELSGIVFAINRLQATTEDLDLSTSNILDAIKQNLYRLIAKGITGFDSPVALLSLDEAQSTLSATAEVLSYFPNSSDLVASTQSALIYLQNYEGSFNEFNRAVFIRSYLNLLCNAMHSYQIHAGIPFSKTPIGAVPASVPNLFSPNAFDPFYFAPSNALPLTTENIALGKQLFDEKMLSSNGLRSCSSCHIPSKAFTDGLKVNESLVEGKKLMRNTPTLINSALQPVQFFDSRIVFLEDQAHEVIANTEEMNGEFHKISGDLKRLKSYRKQFAKVFKDGQVSDRNIKAAIAAYVRSLTYLNSRFDSYMQGNDTAMTTQEINGFNIFMGRAKCGTCHFVPLFNGSVPPLFDKMESEVLGVPSNTDTLQPLLDTDSGKYNVYHIPHQLYSFKTSTVRNAALTAPYMHNGVFNTLEEVIEFYNRGGGAGLGFNLAHQTLPPDRLALTSNEKRDLILFIKALTDKID